MYVKKRKAKGISFCSSLTTSSKHDEDAELGTLLSATLVFLFSLFSSSLLFFLIFSRFLELSRVFGNGNGAFKFVAGFEGVMVGLIVGR